MEQLMDPATGKPLPADAIQRILFIGPTVHVYNIPPRPSTKGHVAATWTTDAARQIFTARLRILETSLPLPSPLDAPTSSSSNDNIKVDVVLEDPKTGALFAAAPYTSTATVEPVLDSSRFFAVTVRDPQGRKAFLGIGFEDRSDAFDFGVALQEARRGLGWDAPAQAGGAAPAKKEEPDKDYSLKEGETITVNIGNTGIGRRRAQQQQQEKENQNVDLQSFALAPPPGGGGGSSGGGGGFALAPPPSADESRRRKRMSAQQLGFDDGQFGEFA